MNPNHEYELEATCYLDFLVVHPVGLRDEVVGLIDRVEAEYDDAYVTQAVLRSREWEVALDAGWEFFDAEQLKLEGWPIAVDRHRAAFRTDGHRESGEPGPQPGECGDELCLQYETDVIMMAQSEYVLRPHELAGRLPLGPDHQAVVTTVPERSKCGASNGKPQGGGEGGGYAGH